MSDSLPPATTSSVKKSWTNPVGEGTNNRFSHAKGHEMVGEATGSFGDLLDVINPLQHIPIVSNIYRAITGDAISAPGRILGGLLFGGPAGMVMGVGGTLMAEATGADLGETLLASLTGSDNGGTTAAQAAASYSKPVRI